MGLSQMSNYYFFFLLGKFLEALGSEIRTGSLFCHSLSFLDNVIKSPQTTNALTFLTHIICAIGGVLCDYFILYACLVYIYANHVRTTFFSDRNSSRTLPLTSVFPGH